MSDTAFDERLIDLVEQNDILYNKEHQNYQSISVKKRVWISIAEQLGCNEEHAIKRYRELRDRFVRSKRMELIRGEVTRKPSYIVGRMNFLTPHIFNKRSNAKVTWAGDVPVLTPALERSQEEPNYSDNDVYEDSVYSAKPEYDSMNEEVIVNHEPDQEFVDENEDEAFSDSGNITGSDTEMFTEAFHSFKQLCESQEDSKESEALRGFVQMIMATIEAMSPKKQIKAMMRVTEVVMKIRMED